MAQLRFRHNGDWRDPKNNKTSQSGNRVCAVNLLTIIVNQILRSEVWVNEKVRIWWAIFCGNPIPDLDGATDGRNRHFGQNSHTECR